MIFIKLFAHHKGGGSTKNGRDSESKRLGPKSVRTGRQYSRTAERNEDAPRQQRGHRQRRHAVCPGRRRRPFRESRKRQKAGQCLRERKLILMRKRLCNLRVFLFLK